MMKSAEYGESNLLAPEYVGFGSCRIGLSVSEAFPVGNCVIKLAFPGKNCSPAFDITILNVASVEEEVGEVVNRVNTEISAGLNQREVEGRDVRTALRNVEEGGIPVNNIASYGLLGGKCEISHLPPYARF